VSKRPVAALAVKERDAVIAAYTRAERRLRAVLARSASTAFQRAHSEVLLEQVADIIADLKGQQSPLVRNEASAAYRGAQSKAAVSMEQPLPTFSRIARRQVEALAAAAGRDVGEALASVVPHLGRVFHDTVQRVAAEQAIDRAIADGIIEGVGSRELTRRVVSTLTTGAKEKLAGIVRDDLAQELAEIGEGRFISLACRDGKIRRYSLKWYGETIARTLEAEASTEGTLATVREYGGDLVQMSFHDGACPLCVPLQGKIYSVSGTNRAFPKLTPENRPPIHPWCGHALLPASETMLRRRGTYDALATYSKRSEVPTTWDAYQEALSGATA